MHIGIVGHEAAKFTPVTEAAARILIARLLAPLDAICVSGACPLGGIDVWAEEIAISLGRQTRIFAPATPSWESGYKPRNILIAQTSDVVHNIVVAELPPTYAGMRFQRCYHCRTDAHVKSGGCWTAKLAERDYGHAACWHVIAPSGEIASSW